MTAKERLIKFLQQEKYPQKRLQDKLGYSNGYIKNTENFSLERIMEISGALPELNIHWLLTGNGSRKINQDESERISELKYTIEVQKQRIRDLEKHVKNAESKIEQSQLKKVKINLTAKQPSD